MCNLLICLMMSVSAQRHLLIEREICIAQNQEHKFIKFNPALENL